MSLPKRVAAALLELRTPLARVALAASQLEREALNPSGHALATNIGEAVEQIDAGIERMLPLLVDVEPGVARQAPLDEVIAALVRRLGPVVATRDARLVVDDTGFAGVLCDPHRTRRWGVSVIRAAARWLGRGGEIRISLAGDPEQAGLRIDCAGGCAEARDAAELLSLASEHPGFEVRLETDEARTTLHLEPAPQDFRHSEGDPSCGAC